MVYIKLQYLHSVAVKERRVLGGTGCSTAVNISASATVCYNFASLISRCYIAATICKSKQPVVLTGFIKGNKLLIDLLAPTNHSMVWYQCYHKLISSIIIMTLLKKINLLSLFFNFQNKISIFYIWSSISGTKNGTKSGTLVRVWFWTGCMCSVHQFVDSAFGMQNSWFAVSACLYSTVCEPTSRIRWAIW